jgi:hypothetical protein
MIPSCESMPALSEPATSLGDHYFHLLRLILNSEIGFGKWLMINRRLQEKTEV